MKYMMLIYGDEKAIKDGDREKCYADSALVAQDLHAQGKFLGSSPLHSASTATSVRVRDGKRSITDGPFAETHEQLGGYFLIEAGNLDEAIEIAERIPGAKYGTVEIRPILHVAGLPNE